MIKFLEKNNLISKYGNILITSSSKKIPIINDLIKSKNLIDSNIKVIAADSNKNVISKYFVNNFWNMPKTNDNNFPNILKKLILLKIKIIIPTRNSELAFWSSHKSKLNDKGIIVVVNNLNKILTCNDKLKFHNFCTNNNILTPKIFDIKDNINKRYVLKQRFNSTNIVIKNISKKDYLQKYKNYYEFPFIQEYIYGNEISVDIWSNKSKKNNYFISRYRSLIVNGESQVTEGFENKKLNKIIERIINKLKLSGPYMLQFIQFKNNFYLIECNPRIGGASTYSIYNGLDMILWSLIEIYKIDNDIPINFHKKKCFNKLVRVPFDTFK